MGELLKKGLLKLKLDMFHLFILLNQQSYRQIIHLSHQKENSQKTYIIFLYTQYIYFFFTVSY